MTSLGKPTFYLIGPQELDNLPEPNWVIEGIIPANSFCVLYGEPGSGKSFVALSMSLAVGGRHNWCGKVTVSGEVLYIAAEGLWGLKLRVRAYQRKHAIKVEQIRYLGRSFDLLDDEQMDAVLAILAAANFQPKLIVLDTLARLMPGADENSAKEMGLAIANIDRLRNASGASVLVIHHSGKNGRSERGSSALRGAADVMIECSGKVSDGIVTLKCDKMKDAELFKDATIGLERVPLAGGESSLAVTDWREALQSSADRASGDAALRVLAQFGAQGATNTEWLDAFQQETKNSKSTFDRALKQLKSAGAITQSGRRYCAVHVGGQCQVSPGVKQVS